MFNQSIFPVSRLRNTLNTLTNSIQVLGREKNMVSYLVMKTKNDIIINAFSKCIISTRYVIMVKMSTTMRLKNVGVVSLFRTLSE